jgi:hypothetical protein
MRVTWARLVRMARQEVPVIGDMLLTRNRRPQGAGHVRLRRTRIALSVAEDRLPALFEGRLAVPAMRKLISIAALAAIAVVAFAVPASAADRKWPAFLKGSVTSYGYDLVVREPPGPKNPCLPNASCPRDALPPITTIDRLQAPDLKLKRERVKIMRSQIQVVYKVVGGTVTWSHETSYSCEGVTPNFTERFSLKGSKWDIDSRITFFAPKTGRHKNRWRMDGMLSLVRDRQVGICMPGGDPGITGGPAITSMPPLFTGLRVGEIPPIARPGQTVRLSSESNYVCCGLAGSVSDHRDALTIRIPPL